MSLSNFDVGASGLYVQKTKMEAISSNIANVNTTRDENGNKAVYKRKDVVFSTIYDNKLNNGIENDDFDAFDNLKVNNTLNVNSGVGSIEMSGNISLKGNISYDSPAISKGVMVESIVEDQDGPRLEYNPSHPDANEDGYVELPNVNIVDEMVGMIEASRAYEANVTQIQTSKSMINAAMKI